MNFLFEYNMSKEHISSLVLMKVSLIRTDRAVGVYEARPSCIHLWDQEGMETLTQTEVQKEELSEPL